VVVSILFFEMPANKGLCHHTTTALPFTLIKKHLKGKKKKLKYFTMQKM
jgi:hypothetical protein